jgi:carbohydrate-selective porin OprB
MTRFEAAALLNACLDRVTEVTDELKRLMKEFEKELAILKGRVDGLEARVGELEATQFSTTTKLTGKAEFTIGATSYGGQKRGLRNPKTGKYVGDDGAVFSYRTTLNLNTSFTGKDLLYTRLRTGNFNDNAFSGKGYTKKQTQIEASNSNDDALKVDKLWYQFPLGNDFQAFVGPKIENYYMLAATPGVYKHVLKQFKLGGYYGAYGASTSPGVGINWISNRNADFSNPKFKVSVNYVAKNGKDSNPETGGIATDNSKGKFLSQLAYGNAQWQVSAAYAYSQKGMTVGGAGTTLGAATKRYSDANQFNLNAYYQPLDAGWIPSISVGWSISSFNGGTNRDGSNIIKRGDRTQAQGWLVGLNWKDAFMRGNRLGFAVGQPQFVTKVRGQGNNGQKYADDGNYAFELYYDFQVTDNITVTPALFYLSRPFGQETGANFERGGKGSDKFSALGGLVLTTFKF